ncbi:MAG: undecaprenyldiphospho-muramoylpentapeptide beta-N-acetylglucosaminyltransferase [Thermodesulfobacteriota bacterium]
MKKMPFHSLMSETEGFARHQWGYQQGGYQQGEYQLEAYRPFTAIGLFGAAASEKTASEPFTILMAGGITGGHLFPGIAIAEAFCEKNSAHRIVFVSVGNPFERAVLGKTMFETRWVRIEGIKGRSVWRKLKAVAKIPGCILESAGIIRECRPRLVIGLGGFSSGPVVVAARLLGIPVVLHEQNILPGITNRLLARFARRVYVSFPNTKIAVRGDSIRLTGNPVRRDILASGDLPPEAAEPAVSKTEKRFTVLVLGGSQGAHRINMAVIEALGMLRNPADYCFIHQTGEADEGLVKGAYMGHGITADVRAFFHGLADQYRQADLIICRAGATTIAEITAIGKPAVFIPYPYAADDHQLWNARALADHGAADVLIEKELCGAAIAEKIDGWLSRPERLEQMAILSRKMGRPNAAEDIVADCYELLNGSE